MRGYRGGNVAGLTLRPFLRPVPEAPAVGLFCCWCMAGVLGSIPEIVLHPPLHRTGNKKPRYRTDSRVSFIYLVGREGLEPATKGL